MKLLKYEPITVEGKRAMATGQARSDAQAALSFLISLIDKVNNSDGIILSEAETHTSMGSILVLVCEFLDKEVVVEDENK